MKPLRIWIGWDEREAVAYDVLKHSIERRASVPVDIQPLKQPELREAGLYWRTRSPLESTAFSLTRFLVPFLAGYDGPTIFLDCDMLMLGDVADLLALTDESKAFWCVKHDYEPKDGTKFLRNRQTSYRCKNWSSLMVLNADQCRDLTLSYVNSAHGLELHQFFWLGKDGEGRIGSLPPEWNWLVGEYEPTKGLPANLHWTLGGPWLSEHAGTPYSDLWLAEYENMTGQAYRAGDWSLDKPK